MFAIALVFGTLYIVGRGAFGMILTMHAAPAAWFWTITLWFVLCAAAARAARAAYREALCHLGARHRLMALARPRGAMFILAGVFAPKLPTTGAAVTAAAVYAALLGYAALLTAFPGMRDRIDRFCHDQLFEAQRASDLQALGLPPAPAEPAARPVPRVAPYSDQDLSVAHVEPLVRTPTQDTSPREFIHVHYGGKLAAVAAANEYFLVGRYAELDPDNPESQFVSMMAVYAMELASGQRHSTYSDDAARIVARITLVPAEVFERGLIDRDATAKAYGVPIWELGPEAIELTRRALAGS